MLAVDITSGFIWAELHYQVSRWIQKVNNQHITKWILYLAALEEEDEISLERIQRELWQRQRVQVAISDIKDVLVKLSLGDLLLHKAFGDWFGPLNDPILNEFLKVWGQVEVAKTHAGQVQADTLRKYRAFQRRFHNYKGYLAEVFMTQVLWNGQRKTLPGRYFHSRTDVQIPHRFIYIDQRRKLGAGKGLEIDIFADAGKEIWLAESKWWDGRKVGVDVVQKILAQGAEVWRREGDNLRTLRIWLFAHDGVTDAALHLLEE